jgi:5-oxoprolinase (ATP-hydrolysing)
MQRDFATEHQTRYGFIQPEKELIIESIAVESIQRMDTPQEKVITRTRPNSEPPTSQETIKMFALDKWHDTKVYRREDLQPEDRITGAAIIVEPISTIIIEPNWQARVSDRNYLILERS